MRRRGRKEGARRKKRTNEIHFLFGIFGEQKSSDFSRYHAPLLYTAASPCLLPSWKLCFNNSTTARPAGGGGGLTLSSSVEIDFPLRFQELNGIHEIEKAPSSSAPSLSCTT